MRSLAFAFCLLVSTAAAAQTAAPWRPSTPEEQRLDAAAFVDFDPGSAERLTDIQSLDMMVAAQG
jgi:hypothetical protein